MWTLDPEEFHKAQKPLELLRPHIDPVPVRRLDLYRAQLAVVDG